MSAIPISNPPRSLRGPRSTVPTHIEIVSTRQQKQARPRIAAAIITVGGLFAILAAQLLLTIATSEGAYEIASLQSKQAELARDQQVLTEKLQVLDAPQHLAAEAHGLGMVASSNAAYLRLTDGTVLGVPTRAVASSAIATATDGSPLIPDSLLKDIPLTSIAVTPATVAGAAATLNPDGTAASTSPAEPATPGAPSTTAGGGSVASTAPGGIPTPVTH